MPAGIQVFGSHGSLQIDHQTANICFVQAGVVSVPPAGSQYSDGVSIRIYSEVFPMIALDTNGQSMPMAMISKESDLSGPTNYYTITFKQAVASGPNITVGWYQFSPAPNVLPANGGLVLYNESGVITYASDKMPLRITDIAQVSNGTPLTGNSATTHIAYGSYAGQKLAGILSFSKAYLQVTPYNPSTNQQTQTYYCQNIITVGNNSNSSIPYVMTNAYVVRFSQTVGWGITGNSVNLQPNGGTLLAIDVTNMYVKPNAGYPDPIKPPGSL